MRYMMLAPILLLSVACAHAQTASCELKKSTVVGLSPAALAQVSNLSLIEVICSVPARPSPTKPGEGLNGLRAATTAYEIAENGERKVVPSEAETSGGGGSEREWVSFCVYLPLDPAERELEARKWIANMRKLTRPDFPWQQLESPQAIRSLSEVVSQHRAGHFQVECRVLDGTRVIGVGVVEFEVLFKGRFSDHVGSPGYWEAPPSKAEP